jgi:hypothetical protein
MAYQIVPRSNPHIALGVRMPAPGEDRAGWGVYMLPQDSGNIQDTLWDTRVLFYTSGSGAPLSVIGTSLISRRCGLPLLWSTLPSYMTLGPAGSVDPLSSWIFSDDTGDAFVYIYPSAPDLRQYTLGLNDAKTVPLLSPDPKETWWFVPYDSGGNASEPVMFMSANGHGMSLAGLKSGAVYINEPEAANQPIEPGNAVYTQWRLITPLINRVPVNSQLIRNEGLKTYLHCAGIGQGLNLVAQVPPDHESYGPSLWLPGRTPVAQGFDIPNPSMGGAMATIAPWKPHMFGVYLQDWQADNGVNQLWTFQR